MIWLAWILVACGPSEEELLRQADEAALAALPPPPVPQSPPMALDVDGPLRDGFWFWSTRQVGDAVVVDVRVAGPRARNLAQRLPLEPALKRAELARALRTEQVRFFPMPGVGSTDQATIVDGQLDGETLVLSFSREVGPKTPWTAGAGGVTALDDGPDPERKDPSDTTGIEGTVEETFGRPGSTWAIAVKDTQACLFRWTEVGFGATGRCR